MEKFIIIVAGGSGTRMNSAIPKQFLELDEKPMLMHTIEKFSLTLPEATIIIVLAKKFFLDWKALCKQHDFEIEHELVEGGKTRFHSVKRGLEHVPDGVCVGIHDAARPFVSEKTIHLAYSVAEKKGNAIPSIPLADSIRLLKGKENSAVDRNKFAIIQTPQCFHSALIKKAFTKPYSPDFTDDATVLEAFGKKINLVEGNRENIKITTPNDLIFADAFLKTNS